METITKKDAQIVKRKLNLKPTSKILNVSHHGCLDGSGSVIMLNNYFKDFVSIRPKYNEVDDTCRTIDYDKYDAVFFTDISPSQNYDLDLPENVVLLDHHETAKIHHNPDKMRFVYNDDCATVITRKFISYYSGRDYSYLDEFSNHINNYDLWIDPHGKNWHFSIIHHKYLKEDGWTHTKFLKRFKCGDVTFTDEELRYIKIRESELNNKWVQQKQNYYDLPYDINGCLISTNDFVNELLDKFRLDMGMKFMINRNPNTNQCSVRCKTKTVQVGLILQRLGYGGGHDDAGGFFEDNFIKLKEKINTLCKYLSDNHKELVRKDV